MTADIPFDVGELYTVRLIVLMEDAPQSNKYRQVILNPEQFKKVSDAVAQQFVRVEEKDTKRLTAYDIVMSDELYDLPSNIQDITYEKK
jgi:ABC-type tungstate transport system permease subunit